MNFIFIKYFPACDNYRIVAVISLQNLLIISNQFHRLYKVVYTMIDKQMLCIYCGLTLYKIYIKLTSISENCKRRFSVSSPTTRDLSSCDFFIIVLGICIFSTKHCRRLIWTVYLPRAHRLTSSYVSSSFYFSVLRCSCVVGFFCFFFVLCLVCQMLPVSLDCPFLFIFLFFCVVFFFFCYPFSVYWWSHCCQCLWIVLSWLSP